MEGQGFGWNGPPYFSYKALSFGSSLQLIHKRSPSKDDDKKDEKEYTNEGSSTTF